MASDVAQFMREAFLASLQEVELPPLLDKEFRKAGKLLTDADEHERMRCIWSSAESYAKLLDKLYDLNDALAECREFVEQQQQFTVKKKNKNFFCLTLNPSQAFVGKMTKRLESINKALFDLIKKVDGSSATVISLTRKLTSPEADTSQFIEFGEDEEKVATLLSDGMYKAIGVYGMSGSGKTALVQKILSLPNVRKMFDPIIWVCLSDTRIDDGDDEADIAGNNITEQILCKMGCDVDEWPILNPTTTQSLQHLKKSLMSKKYLIVLDDVCQVSDFLSNLGDTHTSPGDNRLSYALPKDSGGAVIITSRLKQVAEKIVGHDGHMILMKPWDKQKCELLFLLKPELGPYKLEIVNWLIDMRRYKAIGIYGPSCPTNARLIDKVLESSSVRENFSPIIRVCVSEEDTPDKTLSCLLGKLNYEVDEAMLKDHAHLFETLKNLLKEKKYLIVLDDVRHLDYWYSYFNSPLGEDYPHRLSQALPRDSNGAVIVTITGTSEHVARYFVGRTPCLLYLNLADQVQEDIDMNEVVELCGGLPLAVKTTVDIYTKIKGIRSGI